MNVNEKRELKRGAWDVRGRQNQKNGNRDWVNKQLKHSIAFIRKLFQRSSLHFLFIQLYIYIYMCVYVVCAYLCMYQINPPWANSKTTEEQTHFGSRSEKRSACFHSFIHSFISFIFASAATKQLLTLYITTIYSGCTYMYYNFNVPVLVSMHIFHPFASKFECISPFLQIVVLRDFALFRCSFWWCCWRCHLFLSFSVYMLPLHRFSLSTFHFTVLWVKVKKRGQCFFILKSSSVQTNVST